MRTLLRIISLLSRPSAIVGIARLVARIVRLSQEVVRELDEPNGSLPSLSDLDHERHSQNKSTSSD